MDTSDDGYIYQECYGDLTLEIWQYHYGGWDFEIVLKDDIDNVLDFIGGQFVYAHFEGAYLDAQKALIRWLDKDYLYGDPSLAMKVRKRESTD